MAGASLSLKIGADAAGLTQELGQASKEVQDFGKQSQKTAGDVERSVASQVKAIATAGNYKKQLRMATMEVQNLTMAYRQLTEEQKGTQVGQAIVQRLEEAKQKAAELRDMMADTNIEIKNMASDTNRFDGIAQGLAVVRDSVSAYMAITGLAGKDTKEFQKTIGDITKVMMSMNAVIQVTNALQKQSALMTGIANIQRWAAAKATAAQTVAQVAQNAASTVGTASALKDAGANTADAAAKTASTVATNAQTVATGKLTAAQAAFNAVASMNPYVLVATAIAAAGVALYALISASRKASAQMEKEKKAAEELRKAHEKMIERHKETGRAIGTVKAQMAVLAAEYSNLSTKAEKQRWIEDNKTRFEQLGFSIETLTDAEDAFVNNTGAVVAALVARARAQKMSEQAAQDLIDLQEKMAKEDNEYEAGSHVSKTGRKYIKFSGGFVTDEEARRAGVRTTKERRRESLTNAYMRQYSPDRPAYEYDEYSKEEIAKINKARQEEAREVGRAVRKRYDAEEKSITEGVMKAVKAQQEADEKLYSLVKRKPLKTSGATSGKTEETPIEGSLAALRKEREELLKIQRNGTYEKHHTDAEAVAAEIRKLDRQINDVEFTLNFNADPAKVSLEAVEQKYDEIYSMVRNRRLEAPDMKDALNDLSVLNQALVNKRYSLGLDIKPAEESLVSLGREADGIIREMSARTGSEAFASLLDRYEEVVSTMGERKVELGIDTKAAEGSVEDLQARIVSLLSEQNSLKLSVQTDESRERILAIEEEVVSLRKMLAPELEIVTRPAHASIAAVEKRISELKERLHADVTLDIDSQKQIAAQIKDAEDELKKHKIEIGLDTDPAEEKLKTLASQVDSILEKPRTSSFSAAVPQKVDSKDYESRLRIIEQTMNENDRLIDRLNDQKEKFKEIGQTGSEAYQKIVDKIAELSGQNVVLGVQAAQVDKQNKSSKTTAKNWEKATDALSSFGNALSSIGDISSDSPELNVAAIIAESVANIAAGAATAIRDSASMGPWGWIAMSAGIMAQLAAMVSQLHSVTGFATGGIVGGNQWTGDRRIAKLNSGELVLTRQ